METTRTQSDPKDERLGRIGLALGFYSAADLAAAADAARQLVALGLKPRSVLEILRERGLISEKAERIVKDHYRARYPDRIGGFEVYERVGQGGMGAVYRGRQIDLDRPVAIKVLGSKRKKHPRFVERFLREARAVGRLRHPNIVAGYDAGCDRGVYYVAMEYIEGESLRETIRRRGRLTEVEAIDLAIQISRALGHAHAHGFVHRDVKPHNVLVTSEGVAKLLDLGLVKHHEEKSELTLAGTGLGTIEYASPEQLTDASTCDIRSDVYSLGATLYFILTGELPFSDDDPERAAHVRRTSPAPDPGDVVPALSREVRRIVRKCLEPAPDDRYPDPAALEQDLQRALSAPATPAVPESAAAPRATGKTRRTAARRRPARSRPVLRALGILLALAGVAALAAGAAWTLRSVGLPIPVLDGR